MSAFLAQSLPQMVERLLAKDAHADRHSGRDKADDLLRTAQHTDNAVDYWQQINDCMFGHDPHYGVSL